MPSHFPTGDKEGMETSIPQVNYRHYIHFPKEFIWGTSTAAAQIETASEHEWKGVLAKDGRVFERTSDHEKRRESDAEIIAYLSGVYRCGCDWARLQTAPMAKFDLAVVEEYRSFFLDLKNRGVKLMLVLHHFTNPLWFKAEGSWEGGKGPEMFMNYVEQMIQHFGDLADYWNTFNEPAVYIANGYVMGEFPPFKKNIFTAFKVTRELGRAHSLAYKMLKEKTPDIPVGISKNTVYFAPENILGVIPAGIFHYWFNYYVADFFAKEVDFLGMSYYAKIPMTPLPKNVFDNPDWFKKKGRKHDKMWEYYPEGLKYFLDNLYKRYKKPMMITENGICTDDDRERIASIKDYLTLIHQSMKEGVPVWGYIHWSTFDNFEWHLGASYRFGLCEVNFDTMERRMRPSGHFYRKIREESKVEIEAS